MTSKEKVEKLDKLVCGIIRRLRDEMKDRQAVPTSRLEVLLSDIQTYGFTEFWD